MPCVSAGPADGELTLRSKQGGQQTRGAAPVQTRSGRQWRACEAHRWLTGWAGLQGSRSRLPGLICCSQKATLAETEMWRRCQLSDDRGTAWAEESFEVLRGNKLGEFGD